MVSLPWSPMIASDSRKNLKGMPSKDNPRVISVGPSSNTFEPTTILHAQSTYNHTKANSLPWEDWHCLLQVAKARNGPLWYTWAPPWVYIAPMWSSWSTKTEKLTKTNLVTKTQSHNVAYPTLLTLIGIIQKRLEGFNRPKMTIIKSIIPNYLNGQNKDNWIY